MRILRIYLLKEHLSPFIVTLGGLTAVLLIGNLIKFAELVIARGVHLFDLLRLLIYLFPYMLSFTVPMACLITIVLAFGRLSTDYELVAMRASGVSPTRLMVPMVMVGIVISFVMLGLNAHLVPESHLAFRRQIKAIGIKQPTAYLEAGTFIKDFPPYVIFVYQIEGQMLHHVRIYEPQPNGPTRTVIADRGQFEKTSNTRNVQLKLFDGTVDERDPKRPSSFYKVGFTSYAITLRSDQDDPERIGKKLKELTFKELIDEKAKLQSEDIDTLPVELELHRKGASSFAPLVFVIFGLAFGLRAHHHERLITYVWILAIFLAYYLGLVGMNATALKGWIPAWLSMWTPNLIGSIIAVTFLTKAVRN